MFQKNIIRCLGRNKNKLFRTKSPSKKSAEVKVTFLNHISQQGHQWATDRWFSNCYCSCLSNFVVLSTVKKIFFSNLVVCFFDRHILSVLFFHSSFSLSIPPGSQNKTQVQDPHLWEPHLLRPLWLSALWPHPPGHEMWLWVIKFNINNIWLKCIRNKPRLKWGSVWVKMDDLCLKIISVR